MKPRRFSNHAVPGACCLQRLREDESGASVLKDWGSRRNKQEEQAEDQLPLHSTLAHVITFGSRDAVSLQR